VPIAAAALAAALLSGACWGLGGSGAELPCPALATVSDAAKLTRFAGAGRDLTDVRFEAEIIEFVGACVQGGESVDVATRVRIAASRGPADEERRADFRYFVAVVTRDKRIVGRNVFDSSIEFSGNKTRAAVIEELEQEIPLAEGETGGNYVIYVGFELTPEEVEFNRRQIE